MELGSADGGVPLVAGHVPVKLDAFAPTLPFPEPVQHAFGPVADDVGFGRSGVEEHVLVTYSDGDVDAVAPHEGGQGLPVFVCDSEVGEEHSAGDAASGLVFGGDQPVDAPPLLAKGDVDRLDDVHPAVFLELHVDPEAVDHIRRLGGSETRRRDKQKQTKESPQGHRTESIAG